jgi:hypothetical protein
MGKDSEPLINNLQVGREQVKRSPFVKAISLMGWTWVLGLAIFGAWIVYMWQDNRLPTEYMEVGAKILPDPVEDGGRVTVHLNVRRNRVCPGYVHRLLRDVTTGKIVAIYDPIPISLAWTVGDVETAKTFELPEGLPSYVKYQAKVCFRCNPLQEIFPLCTDAPDIVFSVVQRRR